MMIKEYLQEIDPALVFGSATAIFGIYRLFHGTLRNYDKRAGLNPNDPDQNFRQSLRNQSTAWKLKLPVNLGLTIFGLLTLGELSNEYF